MICLFVIHFISQKYIVSIVFYVCNIPAFSDRGVNISILRHEAEFYGITPLGMA